jgi:diguanylate cyclase (GGDEF)-like protein
VSSAADSADLAAALKALRETLDSGRRAPSPQGLEDQEQLAGLLDELAALYEFTLAISQGELGRPLAVKGSMAGALKTLHAALRHLTWQTQRVASGDFSQRVAFMGEFSEAFNSMVVALEAARSELGQRNEELQRLALQLEELATHDPLTGAFNRRKLNELTAAEISRAQRYGQPLSLFILDIDHFKDVNDTHGHEAGDAVLVALADLLRAGIRATDSLARWGGEEFVVLSPAIGLPETATLAERLRATLAAREFDAVGQVTASFGVADYHSGDTADSLFARADQALYRAKDGGRDRVEVAPP